VSQERRLLRVAEHKRKRAPPAWRSRVNNGRAGEPYEAPPRPRPFGRCQRRGLGLRGLVPYPYRTGATTRVTKVSFASRRLPVTSQQPGLEKINAVD
jgi:hypothetical protein